MSRRSASLFVVILWCGLASATDDQQSEVARMSQDVQSLPAVDQRNIASGVVQYSPRGRLRVDLRAFTELPR